MAQLPWENDQIVQPATGRAGETLVPITPGRQPAPQTPTQEDTDAANLERIRLENEARSREATTAPQDRETQRLTRIGQLRQEFNQRPDVRQFVEMRNAALGIEQLGKRDSAQNDMALIYSFMRSLDPGSVVRETEYATAQNAAGVPEQVRNTFNRLLDGERLSPRQRDEMINTARDLYRARARSYNETAAQYHQLLRDFGEQHPGRQIPVAGGALHEGENQNRGQVEFWDERGDVPEGAEQFQSDLQEAINRGFFTTPEQIVEYARNRGFTINPQQAQAAIDARGREGGVTVSRPTYERPDISDMRGQGGALETTDALIRSTTNGMLAGIPDRAAALANTVFSGGTYDENLRREHAITDYDWEHHPYVATAGTIAGGLAVPTGVTGAARAAAIETLRAGGNRIAALRAAKQAAGARLAAEGAAYGGVSGYTTGDGDTLDRIATGAVDAALGAAGGFVVGRYAPGPAARFPEEAAPRDIPPLVDPTTGRVNAPLEEATPAQRMAAGEAAGISLPAGAAGGRTAALLEKGLDTLPGSAGVMEDTRRSLSTQVDNAVEGLASRYGNAQSDYAAGQAAQRGAQRWISRFEQASERAYRAIPVSDDAQATLTNTRATLNDLTSRFQSNPELAESLRNAQLDRYRDALERGGLSWRDLQDFRSRIGYEIGEQRFSDSPTRDDLRALYAALSEDMRATAAAQGPRALRSFERANNLYRGGQQRIERALVSLLGDDNLRNPERAAQVIRTITREGRGSANLDQLAQIRASLAKGGEWDDVASYFIRSSGQPSNSQGRAFDPGVFVQSYSDMSEPARNLLFGDRGRRELREALDGFVAVQQRLAGTNALRNNSKTAPVLTAAGTVGSIISGLANPLLGLKVATGMAGAYGGARLWTNPAFVRWATGYTRMLAGAARAGVEPSVENMSRQRDYLMRIARSHPEIGNELGEIAGQLLPSPQNGDGNRAGDAEQP